MSLTKKKPLTVKDFLVSGESFELKYDAEKEFLVTTPQPSATELPSYYQSSEYISHTDAKKGVLSFLYQRVKRHAIKKKVHLIKRLNNGAGTLLDIGAGTGDFLREANKKGWIVSGVEVNKQARTFARKKGVVLDEQLEDIKDNTFDVITLWHVLEHISNLEETCQKLASLLNEGGHLVIAVPNYNSFDAKHYKEFWAAYDVPRHLWHFSQNSMKKLFSEKLSLVETRPMIFDSYYVSLLSEKYIAKRSFSLKAIWIGFKSNWKAKTTSEYSSLIYCFKKLN